jgi:hypothetical protein
MTAPFYIAACQHDSLPACTTAFMMSIKLAEICLNFGHVLYFDIFFQHQHMEVNKNNPLLI